MDSQAVVKALLEVDPGFVQLCETLFGKAVEADEVWGWLYTPEGVSKMTPGGSDVSIPNGKTGILVPKVTNAPMPGKPPMVAKTTSVKAAQTKVVTGVGKAEEVDEDSLDVVWAGEFAKFDDDKRQAFGWASIVEVDGRPVIDLQGDLITPADLEDAAYAYVQKSRVGGTQHRRDEFDQPVQAGVLIESKVWTDEKYAAFAKSINVPVETFAQAPRGWEVGFQYEPGETWLEIRKGLKTGFSIHGRGKRVPVAA